MARVASKCVDMGRILASGTAWEAESSKPESQIAGNPACTASLAESALCEDIAMHGLAVERRDRRVEVLVSCWGESSGGISRSCSSSSPPDSEEVLGNNLKGMGDRRAGCDGPLQLTYCRYMTRQYREDAGRVALSAMLCRELRRPLVAVVEGRRLEARPVSFKT